MSRKIPNPPPPRPTSDENWKGGRNPPPSQVRPSPPPAPPSDKAKA
jgi:hypothetical protein